MCEGCWGKSRACQEEKALQAGSTTHTHFHGRPEHGGEESQQGQVPSLHLGRYLGPSHCRIAARSLLPVEEQRGQCIAAPSSPRGGGV